MRRVHLLILIVLVFVGPMVLDAATVSGRFTYDGEEVVDLFSLPLTATVRVHSFDGDTYHDGTVDVAAGTYSVSGVPVGEGHVLLEIDRSSPPDGSAEQAGDLESVSGYFTAVDANESVALDLPMRIMMRVISPVDTAMELDGSNSVCPLGPEVEDTITLTWDPVPRATSYRLSVNRYDCDYNGPVDVITTESTSAEIQLGTAGEDFVKIQFLVTGESTIDIATWASLSYRNGNANTLFLHGGGAPGPIRGTHRTDAYYIPAAASVAGVGEAFWTTALTIFNLDGSPRTAEVFYTPRGSDGTTDYLRESFELDSGSSTTWDDVVGSVFATTGAGSLEVRGRDIIVTSRTSTPGADGGTYGQGIPAVAPHQVMRLNGAEMQVAGGVVRSPEFRTNLGVCEVWGESVQVRVSLWQSDGVAAGFRVIDLPPYGNAQINDLPHALGALDTMADGTVEVTVLNGSGRVATYLSIVDNLTGDPTYVPIGFLPPTNAN